MNLFEPKVGNISVSRRMPPCNSFLDSGVHLSQIEAEERSIELVFQYYSQSLTCHQGAMKYMRERQLDDDKLLRQFNIGFADRTLGLHLQKLNLELEQSTRGALKRVGLLKTSGHEFFRGALVFPFTNLDNQITAAYGRRITPKLKSGSVYFIHWKTDQLGLFNIQAITENNEIILCKSPIDALTLYRLGVTNVVSILGAANYDKAHALLLNKNKVKHLLIAFGCLREHLIFSRKITQLNERLGIRTSIAIFPDGCDPNDYVALKGVSTKKVNNAFRYPLVYANNAQELRQ